MNVVSLRPITVYKTKIELAESMDLGRKHAHRKPYVAQAVNANGERIGYVNLLSLFKWNSE